MILLFSFALSLLYFFSPLSFFPLVFFAPFLVFHATCYSLYGLLWLSLLTGLFVDLFSSSFLGENMCLYLFVTFLLFHRKNAFTENSFFYSAFFSALFALFIEFFRGIIEVPGEVLSKSFFLHMFYFAFCTAIYAIVAFTFPLNIGRKACDILQKRFLFLRKL